MTTVTLASETILEASLVNQRFKLYLSITVLMIVSLSCNTPSLPSELSPIKPTEGAPQNPNQIPIYSNQDTTLGGMAGDPAAVYVPAGAFDTNASAQLSYLPALPAETDPGWTGLGAPIQVNLEGPQTRSDIPMQVTIHFDTAGIQEPGEVFVGYYHDQHGWYFFEPDSVDLEQGTLTFTTYHFSVLAGLQADEATRIDQILEKSAVETFVKQTSQAQSQKQIEEMVKQIMEEGAGIHNDRVIEIITKSVVEQMPGGGIAIALHDLNADELTKVTLETTMSELGKLISSDESTLQEITGSGSTVGAFASASGYFAEGDYEEGLRVMAGEIADNLPVISNIKKIGSRAVELTDEVITNVWFNPEIEKAFQVYENGAEGGWFGYSVDPGDWDALSAQMRGAFAKVQYDYVASYCNLRGIDPNTLSPERRNEIATMGMDRLKSQFDERITRKAQIDEIKANQKALIEKFAENQLLIRDTVNPMYTGNEDLEMLVSRLLNLTERIMRETGRSEIIFHSFDEDVDRPGTQIYGQQIAELARIWYINREKSPEEAEEAFKQAMIEMGLIEAEDDNLIHGVEPQKVTCEGEYTYINTHIEEPVKDCVFTMPFRVEFWNVGALGGADFAGASMYWEYINFDFDDCALTDSSAKVTSGQYSGGPNGSTTLGWAFIQISSGQMGTLSYGDIDESMSGTCTILNSDAFSGWTGP